MARKKQLWAVVHVWEGDVTVDVYTSEHVAQARAVSILFDRIEHGSPAWPYRRFVELVAEKKVPEALKYAKRAMKNNEAIDVQNIGEAQEVWNASPADVHGWLQADAKRILRGASGG